MRYLYSALFYLLLPAVLIRLIWRGLKAPGYLNSWLQRFGYGPVSSGDADVIWIHAVSAGETIAAVPMIRRLQSRYSDKRFIVSNMTPTGAERTRTLLGDSVIQCFAPYDLPGMVKRFLHRARPSLLLIIDTELWPNIIHYCNRMNVKTMLVNGRMSEASARGYSRLGGLTRSMLNEMTLVTTQTSQQGDRFLELGLPKEKLSVTGSIKFDLSLPDNLVGRRDFLRLKLGSDRLIFVAASTHEGEDEIILNACRQLRSKHHRLLLVLVPRHPERFDAVVKLAAGFGLNTVRHSEEISCDGDTDVLVVDAMGELIYFYAVAHFAFVGGSLVPVGGHNMMEAAAFELPIVMGPHVQNVDDIAGLFIEAEAMQMVSDADSLVQIIERLCTDEVFRVRMGSAAASVMRDNKGSLDRVLQLIEDHYDQRNEAQ
jgi:3-deoxy-D-manno-octulosonic-acid transferase